MLSGLANLNLELTSRCNAHCWMCGRRKIERDYPHLANWGDMDFDLVVQIANQLPTGIVLQFHDNGEPLLYPNLGDALSLFHRQVRCLDTNGKLLLEKAEEIIGNLDTITISTFEGDPEAKEQSFLVADFLTLKGSRKPNIIIRCLGKVEYQTNYEEMGLQLVHRQFHNPMGSFGYQKPVTIPEIGICLEALHHLSIKRDGKVAMCVRFDPEGLGTIGDATNQTLDEIWNGDKRQQYLRYHIKGERDKIPLCARCQYWGCPS